MFKQRQKKNSVIVVFVILVFMVEFVSLVPKSHKRP
jgi:hypothetical protein